MLFDHLYFYIYNVWFIYVYVAVVISIFIHNFSFLIDIIKNFRNRFSDYLRTNIKTKYINGKTIKNTTFYDKQIINIIYIFFLMNFLFFSISISCESSMRAHRSTQNKNIKGENCSHFHPLSNGVFEFNIRP